MLFCQKIIIWLTNLIKKMSTFIIKVVIKLNWSEDLNAIETGKWYKGFQLFNLYESDIICQEYH